MMLASPFGGAKLEHAVEDEEQLFVGVVHVVRRRLAAGIELVERAPELAGAGGRSDARAPGSADVALPGCGFEDVGIVGHGERIADPAAWPDLPMRARIGDLERAGSRRRRRVR